MAAMEIFINQILAHKEAAALPQLMESGGLPALISGLAPVHRANLAAALQNSLALPLFVICPDDTAAESFAMDLRAMLGKEVNTLLMRDFCFYNAEAVSRGAEQKRISTLYKLACAESEITVASVSGLVQRTMPPAILQHAAYEIVDGGSHAPDEVEQALIRCGYSRTEQVEGPGQFARRGGILDFYSPGDTEPVRIEYWGDDIDSMSRFDISTQRRTDHVDKCIILPAMESLPGLSPGGISSLCREIERFAANYAKKRNSESAATLAATLRADAERMAEGMILNDCDRYLPILYSEACGLDYIPEDAFVFLDQPNRCAERARDYEKQLNDDVEEQRRRARMAMSPDAFRLSGEKLFKRLYDFPLYMADAFTVGHSPVAPKTLTSIMAKQLPAYGGSAQTAADDVAAYIKQNFSVLVFAADERRA
ncbi:MAG: transcription-repair coupling factor, partial [Oscillospiraceae bacterium]|nr:transcription-repair coupling factor [Oscillospiraceae bacterium]